MAVLAEEVVYRLVADTGGLDGPIQRAEQNFERNATAIEKSATRAEQAIVKSTRQQGAAMRNLSRQFQDVGVQLGAGTSFFAVMSQQLPQIADALQDTQGRFAKFAGYLSNPWVAAAFAAAAALTPLAAGLFKSGNEVDALVDKMRKQARQGDLNRQADEKWKNTIEGLTEAIRKRREESDRLLQTDIQLEKQALANAQRDVANQKRDLRQKERELAEAEREFAATPKDTRGAAESAAVLGPLTQRIAKLRKDANDLRQGIADAEADLANREIIVDERGVANSLDAVRAATDKYTEALGRLRVERQKGALTREQFNAQLRAAAKVRDAEIEAASRARNSRPDADTVPFLRPVPGGSTSGRFGEKRPGHGHGGVDIAVPVGTQVSAAAAGTVIESGTLPGYGNVVIIDHGRGTITRYAHLSKLSASKGDVVGAGDLIGLSGGARGAAGAGNSQGPHLHYEVRRNGRPVDPNGAAFPIDPATARKVKDTIKEDFDKLWDDLQRDAQQASEKITSDFQSLEGAMDPAVEIARALDETIGKIERARLIGLVDDTRAAELQMRATAKASADLLGNLIRIDDLRAAASVEKQELEDREGKERDAEERIQRQREDNVYQLADLFESLFEGGTESIWEEFKRQGIRALALIAAQEAFKAITGQSIAVGSGGGGDLFGSLLGSIFGRASGGYMPPNSVRRVNEGSGRVELLRMGPQGGEVIPLGQTRAAAPAVAAGPSPAIVQIIVDEGAAFVPRVQAISGDVSIQIVRQAAPAIADAATSQTVAALGRPRL